MSESRCSYEPHGQTGQDNDVQWYQWRVEVWVHAVTSTFETSANHWIHKIWRWKRMWNASSLLVSQAWIVHVSAPQIRTGRTQCAIVCVFEVTSQRTLLMQQHHTVISYLRAEWSHLEPPSAEANRRSRPNAQPRCNHRLLKPLKRGSSKPQKVVRCDPA